MCAIDYLSRIITSHSAQACDGQPLRLHCPRHSTISIQSAFYGSTEADLCGKDPPVRTHNHSCSSFTALQVCPMHGMCGTFHSHCEWVCLGFEHILSLWVVVSARRLPFTASYLLQICSMLCSQWISNAGTCWLMFSVCCAEAAVRVSKPQSLPAACPPPAVWEGPLSWHYQIPPCGL